MSKVQAGRRGIFAKDLRGDSYGLQEAVEAAVAGGYAGLHVGSPLSVSPTLDGRELGKARELARRQGLALGVSVGAFNPYQPGRSEQALRVGDGDLATGLLRLAEAAQLLGQPDVMLSVGTEYDRFNRSVDWTDQLRGVASFLKRVEPDLRSLGTRVLIKTHQEITSWEVLRLLDELASDAFGVALDPVNLIVRMEDPLAAAKRLAGFIGQVHMDDARLIGIGGAPAPIPSGSAASTVAATSAGGFARMLCPIGEGCIDWPELIAAVDWTDPDAWYWGELHRAELTMPFAREGWFADHPDLELPELAGWLAKGRPFERSSDLIGDVGERVRAVSAFHSQTGS